ncbi:hypothetical protein BD779DRAFT_117789 [Infundibulicybe gibba]|nr:hypothetical protein BD779DRAFT_117789 [Infundibulicybe gibba]
MDVFGTITSTIDLINKIVSYLQVVRSAEVDCLKLLSGVSALSSLLELLRHRLDSTSADSWNDDVSRAVKASIKGSLDQCHQALESIVLRLSTTLMFGTRSLWWPLKRTQKLKWPFRREEINVALVKIEHLKSLISLAFQTSLM